MLDLKVLLVIAVATFVLTCAAKPPEFTKHGLRHPKNPWDPAKKPVTDPEILREILHSTGTLEQIAEWSKEAFAMFHNRSAVRGPRVDPIRSLLDAAANATGDGPNLPSVYCQKAQFFADVYCGAGGSCNGGNGCPYVYGGADGNCCNDGAGLDCSGLVYVSYNDAGWNGVGRTTFDQIAQTGACPECAAFYEVGCEFGDLFFYCFEQPCPSHVVLYAMNGYVAECPHTGENCHIIPSYTDSFQGCGRYCAW